MNGSFKYWFEYESTNNQNARKVLSEEQLKRQINVYLPAVTQFMEEKMVFEDGVPKHDIYKCESFLFHVI